MLSLRLNSSNDSIKNTNAGINAFSNNASTTNAAQTNPAQRKRNKIKTIATATQTALTKNASRIKNVFHNNKTLRKYIFKAFSECSKSPQELCCLKVDNVFIDAILLEAINNAYNHMKCIEDEFERLELSKRERTVALRLAAGKTNALIAKELFLAESTIKCHVTSILKKAGVKNRQEFKALIEKQIKENCLNSIQ